MLPNYPYPNQQPQQQQDDQFQQQQQQIPNISQMLNNQTPNDQSSSAYMDARPEEYNQHTPSLTTFPPRIHSIVAPQFASPAQPPLHMMQGQQPQQQQQHESMGQAPPHAPAAQPLPLQQQMASHLYPFPQMPNAYDPHQHAQQLYGYYADESSIKSPKAAKRQKTRRKTMVACETCRLKKIRCSNERPSCQSCTRHNYTCFYRDETPKDTEEPGKSSSKASTVSRDVSNATIMNKLDRILEEISHMKDPSAGPSNKEAAIPSYATPVASDLMDPDKETKKIVHGQWYTAAEYILQWPCFGNKYRSPYILESITGEKFSPPTFKIDYNEFTDPIRLEKYSKKLIHNLRYFVNSFVNNVHLKSPVIDLEKLYKTVEFICKNKNFYCIKKEHLDTYYPVSIPLFVAALGMISSPFSVPEGGAKKEFTNSLEQLNQFEMHKKYHKTFSFACFKELEDRHEFPVNNMFYQLGYCIIQYLKKCCYMYLLKPLQAWKHLQRASSSLILLLKTHTDLHENDDTVQIESVSDIPMAERKLIERLYWMIYKEESELRVELSPHISSMPSEILNYPAPSSFPAPIIFDPPQVPSDDSISDSTDRDLIDTNDGATLREQNDIVWYCYLNETALRKVENKFLEDLYSESPFNAWNKMLTDPSYLNTMLVKIKNYLEEISNIVDKLHPTLKELMEQTEEDVLANLASKNDAAANSENNNDNVKIPIFQISEALVFTKTRIVTMKLLLSRPIFYYLSALETKEEILHFISDPIMAQVVKDAFKLANVAQPDLMRHRHNGTWYVLRNLYVGCLFILVVVPKLSKFPEIVKLLQTGGGEAPDDNFQLPTRDTMSLFLSGILSVLKYWVKEAPEFQISMDIVVTIAEDFGFTLV